MSDEQVPEEPNELLAMDNLLTLPEGVTEDEHLMQLYNVVVMRMQREVIHLPVLTLHTMLIDQIAYNYVYMKELQRRGRLTPNPANKGFQQYWLSLVQEFNKLVVQSSQDEQKHQLDMVTDVILKVLATVKDENIRADLKQRIASALDEAGLM